MTPYIRSVQRGKSIEIASRGALPRTWGLGGENGGQLLVGGCQGFWVDDESVFKLILAATVQPCGLYL